MKTATKRGFLSILAGLPFMGAASARIPVDGWQPRKTAPRDGSHILVRHRVRPDRYYIRRPPAGTRFLYWMAHYEPSELFTPWGKYCGMFWRVSHSRAGWIDDHFDEWMALPQ